MTTLMRETGWHDRFLHAQLSCLFAKLGGTAVLNACNGITHARNRVARRFCAHAVGFFARKTGWHGRFVRAQWHHPCAKQGGTTVFCLHSFHFCSQNTVARRFVAGVVANFVRKTGWHGRFIRAQWHPPCAKQGGRAVSRVRRSGFDARNPVVQTLFARAALISGRKTGWQGCF